MRAAAARSAAPTALSGNRGASRTRFTAAATSWAAAASSTTSGPVSAKRASLSSYLARAGAATWNARGGPSGTATPAPVPGAVGSASAMAGPA
jgi:hypothetical protein